MISWLSTPARGIEVDCVRMLEAENSANTSEYLVFVVESTCLSLGACSMPAQLIPATF